MKLLLYVVMCGSMALIDLATALGQRTADEAVPPQTSPEQSVTESKDEIVEIEAVVVLQYSPNADLYYSPVRLGSLEAGKQYKLRLRLANPSDHPISFSGVELNCTCMKFQAEANVILPQASGDFLIHLNVPKRGSRADVSTFAKFIDRETRRTVMQLDILYEMNNMFNVVPDQMTIQILPGQELVTQRAAVMLVPPVRIEDLELIVSKNLRDLNVEFGEEDGQAFIQVTASSKNVANGAISGEVGLKRKGSDDADGFALTVRRRDALSVHPESLRFSKLQSVGSALTSSAVLRTTKQPSDSETSLEPPSIAVSIDGQPALVVAKQMGESGIYKLTVKYDGPVPPNSDGTVDAYWRIVYDGEEREIRTHAFFPK